MDTFDAGPCTHCGGTGFVILEDAGARRARPCGCRGAPRASLSTSPGVR